MLYELAGKVALQNALKQVFALLENPNDTDTEKLMKDFLEEMTLESGAVLELVKEILAQMATMNKQMATMNKRMEELAAALAAKTPAPPPPPVIPPSVASTASTPTIASQGFSFFTMPATKPLRSRETVIGNLMTMDNDPEPAKDDAAREAYYQEVFEEFVQFKLENNESIDNFTYDKFATKLRVNTADLMKRPDVKDVQFSVYIKDGKVSLKARVVRQDLATGGTVLGRAPSAPEPLRSAGWRKVDEIVLRQMHSFLASLSCNDPPRGAQLH